MPDIFVAKTPEKYKRINYKDLPSEKHNPLSSIVFTPENLRFESMDREEKVILFLRKHFITNIPWIIMATFMFLIPAFVQNLSLFDSIPDVQAL